MIDKKQVVALHRQGLTQTEIADKLGCSQVAISQTLRKVGITKSGDALGTLWISVRDGLPKHPHPVLVTVDNTNHYRQRFVQIARYDGDRWVMPPGVGRVVAWMELPEEYRG